MSDDELSKFTGAKLDKEVAGTWMIGGLKGDDGKKFQGSMIQLVPVEFDKLHTASSIEALPFEDLLK